MKEPIRHSAGIRNRRKALHHAKNVRDEAMHLLARHVKLQTNYEYLVSSVCKLVNRLEAEDKQKEVSKQYA